MRDTRPASVKTVTVTIDGIAHHGTYYVQRSVVYVQSSLGAKATQVGGTPPENVAKLLLSEMVRTSRN